MENTAMIPFKGYEAFTPEEMQMVNRAYGIAREALTDMKRGNNSPFIDHPLGVASIVCDEMGLPAECAAALFLHEATRFRPEILQTPEYLEFSQNIRGIVSGLNRISQIRPKDTRLEADNYRRLILSYSSDPRVTLIKIADRLEVMRNIRLLPKSSRERKVLETLMLYIPIAHQLGLYKIKGELEDIYLRYTHPEVFNTIQNKLRITEKDRLVQMKRFIEPLKDRLSAQGVKYKLKARTKTVYSIWKKMVRQGVPFEGVYDVYAIRFIIDCDASREQELALCWNVFSYVTEKYSYDPSRVRDWLSKPKDNGYESLHVTVTFDDGTPLEVQIRTARMDAIAESGGASHWSYKGVKSEGLLDKWLSSVRAAMEKKDKFLYEDMPQSIKEAVFVFSPTGELRQLPAGATLLDFAFNIHTNIGLRCCGGRINGKVSSFRDKLTTGDVVEVFTNKNQKPNQGWLEVAVTSKAKSKIRQKLAEEEFRISSDGKELLGRRLKNWKLAIKDEDIAYFIKKYQLKSVNEFYCFIAEQKILPAEIKSYLTSVQEPEHRCEHEAVQDSRSVQQMVKAGDDYLEIGNSNIKNVSYKLARCCNPVYGDEVFGFVSVKDGITVHRISCPNATSLVERYPYRVVKVKWTEGASNTSAQVTVKVLCSGENNMLIPAVMDAVSTYKASVRSMSVHERNSGDVTHEVRLKIFVPSNLELDKVISALRKIKGVSNVLR